MPFGSLETALDSANRAGPHAAGSRQPLVEGIHIGADTGAIDAVVTRPLPTGGTHIDAAAHCVRDHPDDDVVGEPEPAAPFTGLDAACTGLRGNQHPARHRLCDLERLLESCLHAG